MSTSVTRSLSQALALLSAFACERAERDSSASASSGASPGAEPASSSAPLAIAGSLVREPSCSPLCASIERCESGKCAPACLAGEVFVPSTGPDGFAMGRGAKGEDDREHRVVLTNPFCMDATEVTVARYRACVEGGACTEPQLRDANSNYRPELARSNHPINMVNWKQAKAYCESRAQALPTEAQWEWAARGGDSRRFPWGEDEPTCESGHADFTPGGSPKTDPAGDVGCHGGGTSEVRTHPKGSVKWPGGELFDMAGNVWEWTSDCYLPYGVETATDPNPVAHPALRGECYVYSLRGGGWNRSASALGTSWRAGSKWTYRVPGLGFRCVRNAT